MINQFEKTLIQLAIDEDIGDGDHTSLACIPNNTKGKARLLIKDQGIIAGLDIAVEIFKIIDPSLHLELNMQDGKSILPGDVAFIVEGNAQSILQAERLVLNFMQRMSGIASQTNVYVKKLKGLKSRVLDTRKTTPGLRYFEKSAVKIGGGTNHRIGLFDMILIKDNHVDMAGGIEKAIDQTLDYLKKENMILPIEIEVRSLNDVKIVLKHGGVDRIMLDNFSIENTRKAVEIIQGKVETESSGGITLKNIREYALCGVDYISVGALTHQIQSLDMSLKVIL